MEEVNLTNSAKNFAKNQIATWLKSEIIKSIVKKYVWAGVGIMNPILGFLVGKLVAAIIENVAIMAYFFKVDADTHKQAAEFNQSADKLESAKETGNEEDIRKAEQAAIDAFRHMVKFGNGVSPKP